MPDCGIEKKRGGGGGVGRLLKNISIKKINEFKARKLANKHKATLLTC